MHAVGLHSALAIKRQRKRRDEQRRARERRYSSQSGESGLTSPRLSTASFDQRHQHKIHIQKSKHGVLDTKVGTSIGMLHIGVVFLVLGAFLLISGILPSDLASSKHKPFFEWWNELVAIGFLSTVVGCFLMVLNRIIAKKEEDDLEKYVKRQLTRSKSGHRLERDVETGKLVTKHAKKAKQCKGLDLSFPLDSQSDKDIAMTYSPTSPPPVYTAYPVTKTHPESSLFLDEISEESINEKLETLNQMHIHPELTHERKTYFKNNFNRNIACRAFMRDSPCVEVPEI